MAFDSVQPRRLILAAAIALVVASTGCGGPPVGDAAVEPEALPRWVRIVPVESDGRSWYVGAVSMATSSDEAVLAARLDALSQISRSARERFAELITRANAGSGVTITPIERFQLSDAGREMFAARLEDRVVQEDVYLKPCAGATGTICQAFVLVSLPTEAWDGEMHETLQELRRQETEAGRVLTAEYLDWMIRHQERSSR